MHIHHRKVSLVFIQGQQVDWRRTARLGRQTHPHHRLPAVRAGASNPAPPCCTYLSVTILEGKLMFEAYSVGVTLRLNNLISPQLKILSQEFTKLESLSVSLGTALKGIKTEAAGLRTLASGANASNRALEKASLSAAALEKRLVALRAASTSISPVNPIIPGAAPRAGGGGGR